MLTELALRHRWQGAGLDPKLFRLDMTLEHYVGMVETARKLRLKYNARRQEAHGRQFD